MSAINEAKMAHHSLEALSRLLEDAADRHLPVDQILDEALAHLGEAQALLETVYDDEGTE